MLGIVDGLEAKDLRRPVLPSRWHCLGLVQHLTLDVQRFWFRAVVALAWWPHDLFGDPHLHTPRDVLLHVIPETACHAGHLDAARELIDGRRWLVLT